MKAFTLWLHNHLTHYNLNLKDLAEATEIQAGMLSRYRKETSSPSYESLLKLKTWIEDLHIEKASPEFDANVWFNEFYFNSFRVELKNNYSHITIAKQMKIDTRKALENRRVFKAWLHLYLTITNQSPRGFSQQLKVSSRQMALYVDANPTLPSLNMLQNFEQYFIQHDTTAFDCNIFFSPLATETWLKKQAEAINTKLPNPLFEAILSEIICTD